MADFHKAGLLVVRDGQLLLCRKNRDTALLILPGGKLEAGETAVECLHREIAEELGGVQPRDLEYVGTYRDRAAMPDKTVEIVLYRGELNSEPRPSGEIAELVWFGRTGDRDVLAPSLRESIIPDLIVRKLLPW